jgi:3-isopropylmalate/(R)-2-methylmalate dehydratase large subunit
VKRLPGQVRKREIVTMTLLDKIWASHVVEEVPGGNALIFVDLVVAHELATPIGIVELDRNFGGIVYDPDRIVSLVDHVAPAKDTATAVQAHILRQWAKQQNIRMHDIGDNGICHVVVTERGYVTPGMVVVCGDSHTATLGAFGSLALGVGTTAQTGAMLAQVVMLQHPKTMKIDVTGELPPDVTAKDLILTIIKTIGFKGGIGYVIEYAGTAIAKLSMEERMTVCNMSIEAGATAGLIAPDEKTAVYLSETALKPANWTALRSDPGAEYDRVVTIDGSTVRPLVTWGTNPGENVSIDGAVPDDADARSLAYMDLAPGTVIKSIAIDQTFIGSCTNARISDLRAAAAVLRGRHVSVPTIITPGSAAVKRQAEREGLHDVFQDAGALWTHSSCGPCAGMAVGVIAPGTRVVTSTNRNFPGRMGDGGRIHLASPQVVAASAILGRIASPSDVCD